MGKVGDVAHKILIWSYDRGTVPYDIICILILAFIFLVPPSCFVRRKSSQNRPQASTQTILSDPGTRQPQKQ